MQTVEFRCRPLWAAAALAAAAAVGAALALAIPAVGAAGQPPDEDAPEPPERSFTAPAGLILNYVQAEQTSSYEQVMASLSTALAQSEDEDLREIAAGWRLFRAAEPGLNGSVLYVSLLDPAVEDADYSVSRILAEAVPDEVQELYETYIGAFVEGSGQILVNLTPVEQFEPAPEP